jgi:4-amino-4-deoxy-L-arabinose transferase-like glycosyltransferase
MRRWPIYDTDSGYVILRIALPLLTILILVSLYFCNLGGWLIHDDEGTDLYEIWRIGEGDVPARDVVTAQAPVFLLGGVALGRLSDFSIVVLRGASALLVLGSAPLVVLLGREIWCLRAGFLAAIIYLLNHLIHDQARLFRPDPWMLAFSVLGLYLFVLAQTRERRFLFLLSGSVYGIATLCKLFGALPLGGCLLALAYDGLTNPLQRRRTVENIGLLLISFLSVSLGGMVAFYPPGSTYYSTVLGQHWQLGSEAGLTHRVAKGLFHLAFFTYRNLSFLFAVPLVYHLATSQHPGERAVGWQVPTAFAYLVLSRPLYGRYWLYLVPVFSLILGHLIDVLISWIRSRTGSRGRPLSSALGILLVVLATAQSVPIILRNTWRRENDTLALASYIAAHTEPDEVVLSDYASLNVYARRRSVPQASIIAGGRIAGGFVTAEGLISEIEAHNVSMVLLHVSGGDPGPHHLVNLHRFDQFQAHLEEHFDVTGTFDRAGQIFEIHQSSSSDE